MGALDDVTELLEALEALEGVRSYADPAEATSNRPCVLLTPPATDYTQKLRTWSLKVLAGALTGGLDTWTELDALEDQVRTVLPVEASSPGTYQLSPDHPAVPCHVLTVRTSL